MPGPHPAVAATRCAARDALAGVPRGSLVLVACSGGPDSLALAAAAAFEAPRAGLRAAAVVVDHGLQPDSAPAAERAADACRQLGLSPVEVLVADCDRPAATAPEHAPVPAEQAPLGQVPAEPASAHSLPADPVPPDRIPADRVPLDPWSIDPWAVNPITDHPYAVDPFAADSIAGVSPRGGPEARARYARYEALAGSARRHAAHAVWLGHTLDDQAEQVLLGLFRGSGTRSLAGMPPRRGVYVRPFLGVDRATTEAACAAQGLRPWHDASNEDPAFLRNRVRRALADLGRDLGPGLSQALSRTATLARQDADLLDALTRDAREALGEQPWPAAALTAQPAAIRGRLWRLLAAEAGAGSVSAAHVAALDALVTSWRGQGPVALPGGAQGRRAGARVSVTPRGRQE